MKTPQMFRALALLLLGFLLTGCASSDLDWPPAPDTETQSDDITVEVIGVVTDIDETLTVANEDWLRQIVDSGFEPRMRPGASELMSAYAERGYEVVYITARGELTPMLEGTSAREATEDWLLDRGFPLAAGNLYLAGGIGAFENEAAAYKYEIITGLQAEGWEFSYAYGNAATDIEAFLEAGIPPERVFLVGELAGQMGVEGITDDEAFEEHLDEHMSSVPEV